MTAALCIIFSFFVGVFTGGAVLMIAGNKLITKQLVAEQTKLNAELCSDQGNALLPKEENAYKSPRK